MKPWYKIPIVDNNEKLISIPSDIDFIDPHPYLALGAPYKRRRSIWSLREGVVSRLVRANNYLKTIHKNYSLILYDSWRPIEVQSYMFYLAYESECKRRGLEFQSNDMNSCPEIIKEVEKFWAYPSFDDKCPPPHSTGGAIDVAIVDGSGELIDKARNEAIRILKVDPLLENNQYLKKLIFDKSDNKFIHEFLN